MQWTCNWKNQDRIEQCQKNTKSSNALKVVFREPTNRKSYRK